MVNSSLVLEFGFKTYQYLVLREFQWHKWEEIIKLYYHERTLGGSLFVYR
jgi:hypothetical protein